jgi:signal transduction histidine kinase
MRLRTRLFLALGYTMAVVIVALTIPFALTVERRAEAELKSDEIAQAQQIANFLGAPSGPSAALDDYLGKTSDTVQSRIIVVDAQGRLIADSDFEATVGDNYATEGRPEIQQALDPDQPRAVSLLRRSDDINAQVLATAVPLFDDRGTLRGAVRITEPTDSFHDEVRRTVLGLVAIGAGGLVAGLLVAFVLAGSLSRPMGRLAAAAGRLGDGDLSARAGAVGGGREMADLAETFDDMASRLQAGAQAEREFAANASHQLRTPLAGMRLRLEAASLDATDDVRVHIEAAEREVARLTDTVQQLLDSARSREAAGATGVRGTVDVNDAVARAVERWSEVAAQRDSSLRAEGRGAAAYGDAGDIDHMLDNMIDNALKYAPGPVVVEVIATGDRVKLAVVDQGPGMAAGDADRVTERFYRGQGVAPGGSGLGLAIVKELVERHAGTVTVESGAEGTRVEVTLERAIAAS